MESVWLGSPYGLLVFIKLSGNILNHYIPKTIRMEAKFQLSEFQPVVCMKDNRMYAFKVEDNPGFLKEDYALIKCFRIIKNGEIDFSNIIEIYGKDLVSPD
jgi:hypothetical protein